jgi:hypothetical protein
MKQVAHRDGNDALGWTENMLSESHKSILNGIFTHVTNGKLNAGRIELVTVSTRPAITSRGQYKLFFSYPLTDRKQRQSKPTSHEQAR